MVLKVFKYKNEVLRCFLNAVKKLFLQKEMLAKDREFNALSRFGDKLLRSLSQDEKVVLAQRLSEVNQRWKALQVSEKASFVMLHWHQRDRVPLMRDLYPLGIFKVCPGQGGGRT